MNDRQRLAQHRPDPAKGGVPIDLDGTTRYMVLDFNAIAAFEDLTGQKFTGDWMKNPAVRDIRAFIWAALQTKHPDLTLEDVGAKLSFDNLGYVTERIVELVTGSMPEKDPAAAPFEPAVEGPTTTG